MSGKGDNEEIPYTIVEERGLDFDEPRPTSPSIILQGEDAIETPLHNAASPYDGVNAFGNTIRIHPNTLEALRRGSTMGHVIKHFPDDVLAVLKDYSIVKLGVFRMKDWLVSRAFGGRRMLTRGLDTADDIHWKRNWINFVKESAHEKSSDIPQDGWEKTVQLGAYAVCVRDAAKEGPNELLPLMVKKSETGVVNLHSWTLPAVRGVINYRWQHGTKRAYTAVYSLYLIWVLSFFVYLTLYTCSHCLHLYENPLKKSTDNVHQGGGGGLSAAGHSTSGHPHHLTCIPIRGTFTDRPFWAVVTHISYFTSTLAMIPFGIQEVASIFSQGRRWISFGNITELLSCIIQLVLFIFHIMNRYLIWYTFGTLISTQIVLLYIRMIRFIRTLSNSSAIFLDSAFSVIHEVRHWLIYIIGTTVVFSFSLAALYKRDRIFSFYGHNDFANLRNALITTFEIVFGNFESYYILESSISYVQAMILLGYQVMMVITVINLLIAAMSDSYISLSNNREAKDCKRKAGIIVEMEAVPMPRRFQRRSPEYIHFIIVEKEETDDDSTEDLLKNQGKLIEELRFQMQDISSKLDRLLEAREGGRRRRSPGSPY